ESENESLQKRSDTEGSSAGKPTGAEKGTAYHHVFAALDHALFADEKEITTEKVREELHRMCDAAMLSEAEARMVRPDRICAFLKSDLGRRMTKAALAGTLHREQPFVLDVPAEEILSVPEEAAGETILVQGAIDAYWFEDGEIILMDYKTDRIRKSGGKELIRRYRKQLASYRRALTQITGIPVRETWIWSLYAGAVPLDEYDGK
ncbi:MAG: PD-(D/E)XK nuclease family protein, partial [Eubacterium sp.]|nr:PD-(D/E)XK nuclease family protein [Eubacterium sp.]